MAWTAFSPSFTLTLSASSPYPPPSEFMAERSTESFWSWALAFQMPAVAPVTQQQVHDAAIETARSVGLSELSISVLRMTLAVRSFSPRVEVLKQLFNAASSPAGDGTVPTGCTALIEVSGAGVTCSLADVDALLASAVAAAAASSSLGGGGQGH